VEFENRCVDLESKLLFSGFSICVLLLLLSLDYFNLVSVGVCDTLNFIKKSGQVLNWQM
jgi:hypothetical protein